jgi:hypothetical protein
MLGSIYAEQEDFRRNIIAYIMLKGFVVMVAVFFTQENEFLVGKAEAPIESLGVFRRRLENNVDPFVRLEKYGLMRFSGDGRKNPTELIRGISCFDGCAEDIAGHELFLGSA